MKRKIAIDCPKCMIEKNNPYYIGRIGIVSAFAVDSVYDKVYNHPTEKCKHCNGLGIIQSEEKISLLEIIINWIMK